MKPISVALLLLSSALTLSAQNASDPAYVAGSVTVPYSEWRRLLDDKQPPRIPDPAPPVSSVLAGAEYELNITPESNTLIASFDAQNLLNGWTSLPCASGSLPILSVEPRTTTLAQQKGLLCLLLNGPSTATVKLTFRISGSLETGLRIPIVPAIRSSLTIRSSVPNAIYTVTANQLLRVAPGQPVAIPPTAEAFTVTTSSQAAREPAIWDMTCDAIFIQEDGRFRLLAKILLGSTSGDRSHAILNLPPEARQIEVEGVELEGWAYSKNDRSQIRVSWRGAELADRELSLRFTLPIAPLSKSISADLPRPERVGQEREVLLVATLPGTEISGIERLADSGRFPAWMRDAAQGLNLFSASGEGPWTFSFRELERMDASDPIIASSGHQTRFSAEGTALTESVFEIEHVVPFPLVLELPPGSKLLRSHINGTQASPLSRGKAESIEIPLPASGTSGKTSVRVAFLASASPFDPVAGRVETRLPSTPLFTRKLDWKLHLPPSFTASAVDGPFQVLRESTAPDEMNLSRALCPGGESTPAEIFYARVGLE